MLKKIKGFSLTDEAAEVMVKIEKRANGALLFPNPAVQVKHTPKNPTV
jgi:hypothetical protein